MDVFYEYPMRYLLLPFFLVSFSVSGGEVSCIQLANRALDRSVWPGIYEELGSITYANKITLEDDITRKTISTLGPANPNPKIGELLHIRHSFGTEISFLLENAGRLEAVVSSLELTKIRPLLEDEDEKRLMGAVYLHLRNLIDKKLEEEQISLEALAEEMGIAIHLLNAILEDMAVPRFLTLDRVLKGLDTDIISFFKKIEESDQFDGLSLRSSESPLFKIKRPSQRKRPSLPSKKNSDDTFNKIVLEVWPLFKDFNTENGDILYFRQLLRKDFLFIAKGNSLIMLWQTIYQRARLLGLWPSQMIEHAGNLAPHIRLEGFESRTLLSDNSVEALSGAVHRVLLEKINQSGLSSEELASKSGVSKNTIQEIKTRYKTPEYFNLVSILEALDLDIVDFLKQVERQGEFVELFFAAQEETPFDVIRRQREARETEIIESMARRMRFVEGRLRTVITQVQMERLFTRRRINPWKGTSATQAGIFFSSLYKISRVSNLPLSLLTSRRPLDGLIDLDSINLEKVSAKEMRRVKKLLSWLLGQEIERRSMTLAEMAAKSHLPMKTIQDALSGKRTVMYVSLYKMVEDGLGMPLQYFLRNFKERLQLFNVDHFYHNNLDINGVYLSKKVTDDLKRLDGRFQEALRIIVQSNMARPFQVLRSSVGIYINVGSVDKTGVKTMKRAVKISRFLGITLKDFFSGTPLESLTDVTKLNLKQLPGEKVDEAVALIKENLSREKTRLGISTNELAIMMGVWDSEKLRPMLQGPTSTDLHRFLQLAEILSPGGDGDYSIFLEGVDSVL